MERYTEKEKRQRQTHPEARRLPSRQPPEGDDVGISDRWGRFLAGQAEKVGGSAYRLIRAHWLGLVNLHLFIFVGGALVAPSLLYLDLEWASKIVHRFYGFFCHQEVSRSFLLFGDQVAICSRCLAFYCSALAVGMWVGLKRRGALSFRLALILCLPAMISVLLQSLGLLENTNSIRVTTGALLGTAVSLYLFPRAQRAIERLDAKPDQPPLTPGDGLPRGKSQDPYSKV
ncbi:MAG: DUF2085 domain-containing protein [Candidatus Zixiibacteriota bacterium]|nr:MAG: DUF2085 domain-containing protein [candidate division Zixibacteria bacterium]